MHKYLKRRGRASCNCYRSQIDLLCRDVISTSLYLECDRNTFSPFHLSSMESIKWDFCNVWNVMGIRNPDRNAQTILQVDLL